MSEIIEPSNLILLGVSLCGSIAIRFLTYRSKAPQEGPVLGVLLGFSFFMSVFWIWLFANILIDMLKILGILTGLPTTFLGLTVLAWGNSIGDFMANTSIARKGFVEMALTGCYAAPLFNILLGLGLSTLKVNLQVEGGIRFSHKDPHSVIPETLIIGSLVTLIFAIIATAFVGKFRMSKMQASIQIVLYLSIVLYAVYRGS